MCTCLQHELWKHCLLLQMKGEGASTEWECWYNICTWMDQRLKIYVILMDWMVCYPQKYKVISAQIMIINYTAITDEANLVHSLRFSVTLVVWNYLSWIRFKIYIYSVVQLIQQTVITFHMTVLFSNGLKSVKSIMVFTKSMSNIMQNLPYGTYDFLKNWYQYLTMCKTVLPDDVQ